MSINDVALRQAADALYSDLGSLDDLTPELRNTIANVYYKIFALRRNLDDPSQLLGYDNSDAMSTYKGFMEGTTNTINDFKHAKELIESMRETRKQNENIYEYLVTFTLDMFKYRIPNVQEKSGIRRALERKFRKPNETPGLYEKMRAFW